MHQAVLPSQPVPIQQWHPAFPDGIVRAVVLHWTAGDYATVFPAYHFCLAGARTVMVHTTHDLRANMRDVRVASDPYAAHAAGRNSFCAGVAICAMHAATPADFGAFPITDQQVDALCTVAAALVRRYGIALDAVQTHAELAVHDGYFGAANDDERWDLARLRPAAAPPSPAEAVSTGSALRARIAALV